VFPILWKYFFTHQCKFDDDDDEEEQSDDSEDENRYDRSKEIKNHLLNARSVCKSWKFGVDAFLQNHSKHYNILADVISAVEYNSRDGDRDPVPLGPYKFRYNADHPQLVNEVKEFAAMGFPTDRNPFINRYVQYDDLDSQPRNGDIPIDLQIFHDPFVRLLNYYGKHIWHAEFIFRLQRANSKRETLYLMIQRFLSLMPNLRTLKIFIINHRDLDKRQLENPSLRQLLVTNPLPKLEHLVALKMVEVPDALQNGLLLANSHVRSFSFDNLTNIKLNALEEFGGTVIK